MYWSCASTLCAQAAACGDVWPQLAALLRAVHGARLALRPGCLHPTKVLLHVPSGRLRVSSPGARAPAMHGFRSWFVYRDYRIIPPPASVPPSPQACRPPVQGTPCLAAFHSAQSSFLTSIHPILESPSRSKHSSSNPAPHPAPARPILPSTPQEQPLLCSPSTDF